MSASVSLPSRFTFLLESHRLRRENCTAHAVEHIGSSKISSGTPTRLICGRVRLLGGPLRRRNRVTAGVSADSPENLIVDGGGSSGSDDLEEARHVVVDIFVGLGVSKNEALEISSKCPAYIQTLVGNVRELDESGLWNSWQIEEGDAGSLGFRKKVWYVAKEKGDNGLIPFLESIGLSSSTSTYVARYLSGKVGLVELVEKVKFVKEILFSERDRVKLIGKNARRMMKHFSISADDDVQRTLSYFEKMEARRGGLNMLDQGDASFPYLIESFPRVLLLSIDSSIKPLVQFFEEVGVPKGLIGMIILLFPPTIFYNIEKDIIPRIKFFARVGIEDKEMGKVLVKYPWILSNCIQENYREIVFLLSAEKVPKASITGVIKSWPHILGCSTGRMKLVLTQFVDLGVRSQKFAHIISSSPQLLLQRPQELLKVVTFMEELGFESRDIGKLLCRCPEIFAANIENTLKEKIRFITDLGIPEDHFPRVIRKYPEFLVCSIHSTLKPRMDYLMKVGLSRKEVASIVYRFSPLLGYSIEGVLKPKLEFLVYIMDKPIKEVVEYPRYFSYSLEKRIKPRFWVVKRRDLQCTLREMLGKNDEDFAGEYLGISRMLVPPDS
ncbi:Transcription termination factor 3 [Nymphaea thermarum]|nr:Transcription termination factor 3 [Nymphaea thermarum]